MSAMDNDGEEDAGRAVEGGSAAAFVERLLERIGGRANVRAVFGEPVERDGITIVPISVTHAPGDW